MRCLVWRKENGDRGGGDEHRERLGYANEAASEVSSIRTEKGDCPESQGNAEEWSDSAFQ